MIDRTNPFLLGNDLRGRGIRLTKALGQHLLVDRSVLGAVTDVADLQPGERVLEIGPGAGVLTEALVAVGVRLTAFELDPNLAQLVREDFPSVDLVEGNALHLLEAYAAQGPYKVVANIPYGITSPLLRLLCEGSIRRPISLTLLIQKEVAERVVSGPGSRDRSYLSVVAEYAAEMHIVAQVPRQAFFPPPKVQSAVIHGQVRQNFAFTQEQEADFFRFVRQLFVNPRKQLRNVASVLYHRDAAVVQEQLSACGFGERTRAEELSLDDWIRLYQSGFQNGSSV